MGINQQNKGITLIALVVTIIILLILAGITIGMLLGNNGIINKAKQARDLTREGEIREAIEMAIIENDMNNYTSGIQNTKKSVVEELYKSGKLTKTEYNKLLGLNGETEVDVIKIGTTEIDFSGLGTESKVHGILLGKLAGKCCESIAHQPETKGKLIIAYNRLKTDILSSNESQAEAISYIGSKEVSDGAIVEIARHTENYDKIINVVEMAMRDIKGTTGEKAIALGKIAGAYCENFRYESETEEEISEEEIENLMLQVYEILKTKILLVDETQVKEISYMGSSEISWGMMKGAIRAYVTYVPESCYN